MVSKTITDNGFSYDSMTADHNTGEVEVFAPTGDISALVTRSNIEATYDVWRAAMDIIDAAAQAEYSARETEVENNEITGLNIGDVDAWLDGQIDGLTSVAELKVFLKIYTKKVVRYLKAHER